MTKQRRGFGAMDPEKQKKIASQGGKKAHAEGSAHEFTSDEARIAGAKGGRKVSADREHMARIGRIGGSVKAKNVRRRRRDAEAE